MWLSGHVTLCDYSFRSLTKAQNMQSQIIQRGSFIANGAGARPLKCLLFSMVQLSHFSLTTYTNTTDVKNHLLNAGRFVV
jgi:hypothetical protein